MEQIRQMMEVEKQNLQLIRNRTALAVTSFLHSVVNVEVLGDRLDTRDIDGENN